MQSNLELIYDCLTAWYTKLQDVYHISVNFSELGLILEVTWRNETDEFSVRRIITKDEIVSLDSALLAQLEEYVFQGIERQHMIYEVGEE